MKEFLQMLLLLPEMAFMYFLVAKREERRAILVGIILACIPLYILGLWLILRHG